MSIVDQNIAFGWGATLGEAAALDELEAYQRQMNAHVRKLEAMITERDTIIQQQGATIERQAIQIRDMDRQMLDAAEILNHEKHLHKIDEAWGTAQQAAGKALAAEIRACPEFEDHHPLLQENENDRQPIQDIKVEAFLKKANEIGLENPEKYL